MNIATFITKYDPENQYDVLINYYKQIESAWNREYDVPAYLNDFAPKEIIISGMGGSAISANLLRNFLVSELLVPTYIVRNYTLPQFVGKDTLLIISSYSGNTEETLSTLNQGVERGCKIVCLTTGGKIGEIANDLALMKIDLNPGFQPRFSIGQSFFTLLKLFQKLQLVDSQEKIVSQITELWRTKSEIYGAYNEELINTALKLLGKDSVIYSAADVTDSVGMRLKGQLNENAKKKAYHLEYPEMSHNEIISWENVESPDDYVVINISDSSYHPQVTKRFTITNSLIAAKGVEVIELKSEEESSKERILDLILRCDWITYYAAVLSKKDPSEIDYIHYLKKNLE